MPIKCEKKKMIVRESANRERGGGGGVEGEREREMEIV